MVALYTGFFKLAAMIVGLGTPRNRGPADSLDRGGQRAETRDSPSLIG